MRNLASIQKIIKIKPIENADKIEMAQVLGWECVIAKKDNYKEGDLVVFFEIDSILPEKPEFEFLKEKKYRVKTAKFKGQISQGLVMPLNILPKNVHIKEGLDVSKYLGVKKYEDILISENFPLKKVSKVITFLMNFKIFRILYKKLNSIEKRWPTWISHTDEERIQNCSNIFINNLDKNFYITEKLDGTSATFFIFQKRIWGFNKKHLGVCSRNIWIKKENNSVYWQIARQFDLKNKLIRLNKNVVIQGEIIGSNIQKNKYCLNEGELDFYVFNVFENGIKFSLENMKTFCKNFGLKTVPILEENFVYDGSKEQMEVINFMINNSKGKSKLCNFNKEGIVVRLKDNPNFSFKVINPEFLLLHNE